MSAHVISLRDGRALMISALAEAQACSRGKPFVALLPAFSATERRSVESASGGLLDSGCREFCCVGPEAELLHDSIDELVEARGESDIVTTWHLDCEDAAEYFVYGAGGGELRLVALVLSHPEVVAALESHFQS